MTFFLQFTWQWSPGGRKRGSVSGGPGTCYYGNDNEVGGEDDNEDDNEDDIEDEDEDDNDEDGEWQQLWHLALVVHRGGCQWNCHLLRYYLKGQMWSSWSSKRL